MKTYDFDHEQILKRIDQQVTTIVAKMKINTTADPAFVFFDNAEFIQLMNISKRTAVHWRSDKIINYSIIGSKIYYTLADIQKLINNHKITKPFNGTDI